MVNRNLLRQFDSPDDANTFNQSDEDFNAAIADWIQSPEQDYEANKIVTGKVLEIRGDDVVIDIGYKSEGVIKLDEWKEDGNEGPPPKPGDTVEVLLETAESEDGTIQLSYRKAKRQKEWNAILAKHKEGDVVTVSSPQLGKLANRMTWTDKAAPWTFGASHLFRNLAKRGLL